MDPDRLQSIFIGETASVRAAIESIDAGAIEIALVVKNGRRLVGTLTDGDIRRALLNGVGLDDSVEPIINQSPTTAPLGTSDGRLLQVMADRRIQQIPLLSDDQVVDVAFMRDLVRQGDGTPDLDSPVVLMAGGQGTRLRPLTEQTPKPMLEVAGRPLLEHVLNQVREAGLSRVLISVNYRADVIESHFGNGSHFGVDIGYIREDRPLGSAGALRLAVAELDRPFVVINADLLTNVNLRALMRFHVQDGNAVTVGVRQYVLELPYGVLELDGTRVVALSEKPKPRYFVNAGIYAVDPSALALIDDWRERFDMTDLISAALAAGRRVGAFPVREYWLDVGQLADYQRADSDHATHFTQQR